MYILCRTFDANFLSICLCHRLSALFMVIVGRFYCIFKTDETFQDDDLSMNFSRDFCELESETDLTQSFSSLRELREANRGTRKYRQPTVSAKPPAAKDTRKSYFTSLLCLKPQHLGLK